MNPQFNKGIDVCTRFIGQKRFYGFELVETSHNDQYIGWHHLPIIKTPHPRKICGQLFTRILFRRAYYRMTAHGRVYKTLIKSWETFSTNIDKLVTLEVVHE